MLQEKDYIKKKREFIRKNLTNDTVYKYLTPKQKELIKRYYELYTITLFHRLRGSLRLSVTESKAKKLASLKGEGNWEFAGMVDMYVRGAGTCELGHPLRYCYQARNIKNNGYLIFGSTCVGDFFDLDAEGVKALNKVKDVMLQEIKEIVSIMENKWLFEHQMYDCDIVGRIWCKVGLEGLERLRPNPFINIMLEFINSGLPIPMSLLGEILLSKESIEKEINAPLMGLDEEGLKSLFNTNITYIQTLFKVGYLSVKRLVQESNQSLNVTESAINKVFNLCNIDGLKKNTSLWLKRDARLKKALDYFKKIGVESTWVELFERVKKDNDADTDTYLGINLLTIFDYSTDVREVRYTSSNCFKIGANNESLHLSVIQRFDELMDKLATKDTIQYILEKEKVISREREVEVRKKEEEEEILNYIVDNIDKAKYETVWGKDAIKDIVVSKGLVFETMTEKQAAFVKRVYAEMRGHDLQEQRDQEQAEQDNRIYELKDRPDIISKIQRLQVEGGSRTPEKTLKIMETVMKYKRVSDRQLNHINRAYLEIIIGESPMKEEVKSDVSEEENKKYRLYSRPDIQEKINEIKESSMYEKIPQKTKDIIVSVEKYNTVSTKQIFHIDEALKLVRL